MSQLLNYYIIYLILIGGVAIMRKVELSMKYEEQYNVIKKLVESNGNKKNASLYLGCSLRTINRLIKVYKEKGKSGFIHGNKNKKPACAFSDEIKNKIITLYKEEYEMANLRHFSEIVYEDYNIKVSDTTINKWLKSENILSPKAHRQTKKTLKKKLKQEIKNSNSKKQHNEILEVLDKIDHSPHPRRPRCKYMGEMIQMDASSLEWIPGEKWHLHVAIDDASGVVVGAYFDWQETLNAYYNVLYQILNDYGIPAKFYTDKRTVFEYKRKDTLFENEDTFTQFSYACHQLGVSIDTTSVAQAKGRVERLNQTLQSRIVTELKRNKITSIKQANEFLKSYLPKFNNEFALHLNDTNNVFELQPCKEDINNILAVIEERKIDKGNCFKYYNKYYFPINENGEKLYFKAGTECLVIKAFDSHYYVNIDDKIYNILEVDEKEEVSKEFDNVEEVVEQPKKKYKPPMTHPWKRESFKRHLAKQAHLKQNHEAANV